MSKAVLVLKDGAVFEGNSAGAEGEVTGEVVFNTSMTGYQEILSDPSYRGQIVLMTYPHIGNYGVNDDDMESERLWLSGFAMGECCKRPSSHRSRQDLGSFLRENGIVSIDGIDTRRLTRHIRDNGSQPGIIASGNDVSAAGLVKKLQGAPHPIDGRDLAAEVSCRKPYNWQKNGGRAGETGGGARIAAYDFGIKYNILRLMSASGLDVTVFPADYDYKKILDEGFDGVFLSNGPGDPVEVKYGVENVKNLLGRIPLFGICLGHQILGLALGGNIKKLPFGHHGGNHPVMDISRGKVEITAQNHNYVVDFSAKKQDDVISFSSFGTGRISHVNLNDNSIEGLECLDIPAFSIQYHPESSPGPHDSHYLFDRFTEMIKK